MRERDSFSDLRELSVAEIEAVAGGDDRNYWNGTTLVSEHYDADGWFTGADYYRADGSGSWFDVNGNSGSWSSDAGFFGCIGANIGIGGGFCYGGGDLYSYGSFGIPHGVDLTFGYSENVPGYLTGTSVAANGLPGGGISYNPDGSVSSAAITVGTPGGGVTYGVNATQWWNGFVATMANGFYDQLGRPYDAPPLVVEP